MDGPYMHSDHQRGNKIYNQNCKHYKGQSFTKNKMLKAVE